LGTLLCHTKIQIKLEFDFDPLLFHEVMALGLKKNITNYQFSALFWFELSDIHVIFGTLLCHTKIQIKLKFGFDPLVFSKLWPLDLEKYYLYFICSSPTSFAVLDS
jgi:hypothetical protein